MISDRLKVVVLEEVLEAWFIIDDDQVGSLLRVHHSGETCVHRIPVMPLKGALDLSTGIGMLLILGGMFAFFAIGYFALQILFGLSLDLFGS